MVTFNPPITGAVASPAAAAIRTAVVTEIVSKLTFCNVSANPATLNVLIKSSGGTARSIVKDKVLQTKETYECFYAENQSLGVADELQAGSSVAAALEFVLTLKLIS